MTGAISIVTGKALKKSSAQQKAPVEFSGAFSYCQLFKVSFIRASIAHEWSVAS